MSARAAARLETLGFRHVYRYQPGKADWFAAGLPREGMEAGTARVVDVAERDVPTCTVNERVGEIRDRLRSGRMPPSMEAPIGGLRCGARLDAERWLGGGVTSP